MGEIQGGGKTRGLGGDYTSCQAHLSGGPEKHRTSKEKSQGQWRREQGIKREALLNSEESHIADDGQDWGQEQFMPHNSHTK